jgi:predicted ribosomally synthesized peptide with nif11-like leader
MSKEMAQSFVYKISADTDLRSRFAGFVDNAAALIEAALQAGYSFTAEEYRAALSETEGELTDGDLGAISGGFGDVNGTFTFPTGQSSASPTAVEGNLIVNNEFTGGVRPSLPAVQTPGQP